MSTQDRLHELTQSVRDSSSDKMKDDMNLLVESLSEISRISRELKDSRMIHHAETMHESARQIQSQLVDLYLSAAAVFEVHFAE